MISPAPLLKAIFIMQPGKIEGYPGLGKCLPPVWSGEGCSWGLKFGLNPGPRWPGKELNGLPEPIMPRCGPLPGPEAPDLDFSKVIVETMPSFLILTFAFFASISSTSSTPWRCPSVKINDSADFGGLPGGVTSCTMNKARLPPKIVMIPVNSTLGGGGAASSIGGGGSGSLRSKTLRRTITSYGLLETSPLLLPSSWRTLVAPACTAKTMPPSRQPKIFPLIFIDLQYADFESEHRHELLVSSRPGDMIQFASALKIRKARGRIKARSLVIHKA